MEQNEFNRVKSQLESLCAEQDCKIEETFSDKIYHSIDVQSRLLRELSENIDYLFKAKLWFALLEECNNGELPLARDPSHALERILWSIENRTKEIIEINSKLTGYTSQL